MKHSSTFLIAAITAVALAACGPRKTETTTGGETGATGSAYDTTSATGTMGGDTTTVKTDSPAPTKADSTAPAKTDSAR